MNCELCKGGQWRCTASGHWGCECSGIENCPLCGGTGKQPRLQGDPVGRDEVVTWLDQNPDEAREVVEGWLDDHGDGSESSESSD